MKLKCFTCQQISTNKQWNQKTIEFLGDCEVPIEKTEYNNNIKKLHCYYICPKCEILCNRPSIKKIN